MLSYLTPMAAQKEEPDNSSSLHSSGAYFSSTKGLDWVCIQVRSRREIPVATILREMGLKFYVPMVSRAGYGRRYVPLFPRYVFAEINPEQTNAIRALPGVVKIHAPDQTVLIDDLRALSEVLGSPAAESRMRCGDEVEVVTGVMAGLRGTILGFKDDGRSLTFSVEAQERRRVSVQIDSASVVVKRPIEPILAEQISYASAVVDEELVKYFARRPERLYEVDPRKFEELVAELLRDMGYDVRLTPSRADGGRDILAVFKVPAGEVLTIVECKRFAAERHIGPDLIQRLLWVADRYDKSSMAMLATTSFFSKGARNLERDFRWRLGLKDFDSLTEWLGGYGHWHQKSSAGIWLPEGGVGLH
jgi:transcription antitermination factor NusG